MMEFIFAKELVKKNRKCGWTFCDFFPLPLSWVPEEQPEMEVELSVVLHFRASGL